MRLVPVACMPSPLPRQDRWTCSLMLSIGGGLPRAKGGSAPALPVSRPAWRSLALRPACSPSRHCDPLHRRLQRLRYLHRCFDCYRAERTSSRAGLPPAVDQRLFTAHFRIRVRWLIKLQSTLPPCLLLRRSSNSHIKQIMCYKSGNKGRAAFTGRCARKAERPELFAFHEALEDA